MVRFNEVGGVEDSGGFREELINDFLKLAITRKKRYEESLRPKLAVEADPENDDFLAAEILD